MGVVSAELSHGDMRQKSGKIARIIGSITS